MGFEKNVGGVDRLVRIAVGLALLYLGFFDATVLQPGMAKTLVGLFGFLPLLTGSLANCPLYSVIGVTTCPKPAAND